MFVSYIIIESSYTDQGQGKNQKDSSRHFLVSVFTISICIHLSNHYLTVAFIDVKKYQLYHE